MLKVWGRATSSNVQKVMWTAAELDLPTERFDVGGAFGGTDTAEYRAMNPMGLVPTVRWDNGLTMFESNAVVRTLTRADAERTLWPEAVEAEADMWAEWAHNAAVRPIIGVFWAYVRTLPEQRDPNTVASHLSSATKALTIADGRLAHAPFMMGDSLTIADILLGHVLYRYFTMPVERANLPNLQAYYDRLCARPAFATHVMVDYASLWAKA